MTYPTNDTAIGNLLNMLRRDGFQSYYADFSALLEERNQLKDELERERMRLAACGVAAMSNTRETAKENRQVSDEYKSSSFDQVCAAVDREMALRERVAELEAQNPSDCEVIQAVNMNREAELRLVCSALAGIYSNPNRVDDPMVNGKTAAAAAKAALDALRQPRAWSTCDPVRDLCGDPDSDLDGEALAAMRKGDSDGK